MARMYPEMLRHDTASDAERRLFDAFHEGFSDDWVVFSQVRFLARNRKGGARDGEADFVVAHPRHGLLVIEVKGGGISHDARTGRWTSTDRDGVAHEIKDPFKQAADNMYDLRRKLQESELTRGFSYPMAYAVAFPDVWAGQDLGLEAPREIVFDKAEQTRKLKVVAHWSDGSQEDVTPLCRFRSNDESVALVDEAGVVTTPGNGFGEAGEGYVRFTVCVDKERLREVAERIRRAKF